MVPLKTITAVPPGCAVVAGPKVTDSSAVADVDDGEEFEELSEQAAAIVAATASTTDRA
jgi:hypothetical protein